MRICCVSWAVSAMSKSDRSFVAVLDGGLLPDRALVGGKAWSIAHMRALGLPVPPALVITTAACRVYHQCGGELPAGLFDKLAESLAYLERETGRRFGGASRPLLVSVRSGAAVSMPGMMDTVLNLGINDEAERALAAELGNPGFARDTHRRFCEMFARIVLRGVPGNLDPSASPLQWRECIAATCGRTIPDDPYEQLRLTVKSVFESWNGRRARRYRQHHGIPDDLGTAVTVQAMVFGNADDRSGTGVLFSRNPLSGANTPYGEYLPRAQGEDVVSGTANPHPLSRLATDMPEVHRELLEAAATLERENGDVQDIEFTVERGRLFLLQSRPAKRSPAAAARIAIEMVAEGRLSRLEALSRLSAEQVRMLLRPYLVAGEVEGAQILARGEAACPGAGVGLVVADADAAERAASAGESVILARPTTSPEDVHGMIAASGVITEQGGSTSHAAVVGRALGVPCVVGCGAGALAQLVGRTVTVDGGHGVVYAGALRVEHPRESDSPDLMRLAEWAAAYSPIRVYREGEAAPAPMIDLDTVPGGEVPERLASILAGVRGAKGRVLASDAGVRAAVGAGLDFVVVLHVLPALLAAVAATRGADQSRVSEDRHGRHGQ
jgi:pyruvate, orthophosphate dikinase